MPFTWICVKLFNSQYKFSQRKISRFFFSNSAENNSILMLYKLIAKVWYDIPKLIILWNMTCTEDQHKTHHHLQTHCGNECEPLLFTLMLLDCLCMIFLLRCCEQETLQVTHICACQCTKAIKIKTISKQPNGVACVVYCQHVTAIGLMQLS